MSRPVLKVLHEQDLQSKVGIVVGTRPSIVMFSPIIREARRRGLNFFVVHTGQHYSYNMDRQFFIDLDLPEPDYKFESVQQYRLHGEQTAEMLRLCEQVFIQERPKIVLVGGDANTNLAGALAARKLHIQVGHVEAGERSGDWRMPEEHNRVIIDHISEYLFTTNDKGRQNLIQDNVRGHIFVTGNPIVDAAYQNLEIAREKSSILDQLNLSPNTYFVMTMHREENVDSHDRLRRALEGVLAVGEKFDYPIIFLAHPRTLKRIHEFGLTPMLEGCTHLRVQEAVGYLDFLRLLADARLVLTDSGGVQQESCILKVPCVTLRENTEWTETVEAGANTLAGVEPELILHAVEKMLRVERAWSNPFGDGHAASHILDVVEQVLEDKLSPPHSASHILAQPELRLEQHEA